MAYGGLLFTISADGLTPYYPPGALSDVLSGTMLAFGVLAALRQRDLTGEPQYVSTSQLQSLMWLQSLNVAAVANFGQAFLPADRLNPPNPMFNIYPCGGGTWLALGMPIPNRWAEMCECIGRPDLATDPRFADAESRRDNARECVRELDAWFATAPAERWLGPMRELGLWVAPINRVEDLVDDAQVAANGLLRTLADGSRATRMPFTIRGHEPGLAVAPGHGEHTDDVLQLAGLDAEGAANLRASGAAW
jgi:crotonobetainyl-CoA:carnitine CoA-transferase CaiB-like acyl-CoA transferase